MLPLRHTSAQCLNAVEVALKTMAVPMSAILTICDL
jgi:hypothetical protein